MTRYTPQDLIAFEREIADIFNSGVIRAPVHLEGGNELELIEVFQTIAPDDWVATTWRSHIKCLLKGVPRDRLKTDIIAGRSITLCYPEHRIVSSAIVGGSLPIALGIAASIKRAGGKERVHAFVGDMGARGGIKHECAQYAEGHELPIRFIVEDNGLSVCTDTEKAWGRAGGPQMHNGNHAWTQGYRYKLPFPHAGAGVRVQF